MADAEGALWAIYVAYGHSGAWMGGAALDDSECTFAHLTRSMAAMRARGARCVLLSDINLVRGVDDVLASSTPHAGGLDLFASICAAGHMRDAMPPELAGYGVFTNRCGAGRLLPAESLPFGSCARLDYVLVPQDSTVTQWHVPSDLDHCSDTHSPVLAAIRYSHLKGSGARRCAVPAIQAGRSSTWARCLARTCVRRWASALRGGCDWPARLTESLSGRLRPR